MNGDQGSHNARTRIVEAEWQTYIATGLDLVACSPNDGRESLSFHANVKAPSDAGKRLTRRLQKIFQHSYHCRLFMRPSLCGHTRVMRFGAARPSPAAIFLQTLDSWAATTIQQDIINYGVGYLTMRQ